MSALLAPDPAVPQRDLLLDERRMAALLRLRGAAVARCERVNSKYRVGDSLRVAYRIETGGRSLTIAARTFAGKSRSVFRRAEAAAVPAPGDLPAVWHAAELETVFWTFPNDRRLASLQLLADGSDELNRLVGHAGVHAQLVAYAPERAATARCTAPDGRVLAYVKVHWDAAERERANAQAAAAAIGDHPRLRVPRVLAASMPEGALVLEPLPGRRLDGLATAQLAPALRALGAGLATLHHGAPPPGRRFDRLAPERLRRAAEVLGLARPDCRDVAAALCARLLERVDDGRGPAVHVHGDANLRNALVDGGHAGAGRHTAPAHEGRIGLVDLEDAAAGPAAADLGFVLAGLVAARVQARVTAAEHAALASALLAGYAAAAPLPEQPALRWHTAASALARVAMPAVGRVRPAALARLDALLAAAKELAP